MTLGAHVVVFIRTVVPLLSATLLCQLLSCYCDSYGASYHLSKANLNSPSQAHAEAGHQGESQSSQVGSVGHHSEAASSSGLGA